MELFREINKMIMFTELWALPVVTARLFDSTGFLWLLIVSFIGTIILFTHYEDLMSINRVANLKKEGNKDEV